MGKYIEREALIEKLNEVPAYFDNGDIRYGIDIATQQVIEQPTADVVEVVRCEKCKYCEVVYPLKEIGEEPIKGHYCKLYNSYKKQTDFCSYGELKELG